MTASTPKLTSVRRVFDASISVVVGIGVSQALRVAGNIILASLLAPEVFGLMALVHLFNQALAMFSEMGIGQAVIQHSEGDQRRVLNTAWTMRILRGGLLWLCSAIVAWPAAYFYGQPELLLLLPVIGFSALIGGFATTAVFTLQRELQLRPTIAINIISYATGLAAMVAWAAVVPSVWALVFGHTVIVLTSVVLGHLLLSTFPHRISWDRPAVQDLVKFGKWITVSTAIAFLAMQYDRILLGKLVPLNVLGTYSIALALALLPSVIAGRLSKSVLYPLLTRSREVSHEVLLRRFAAARASLVSMGMIMVLAVVFGSKLFFTQFYDARYAGAIELACWLSAIAWLRILQGSTHVVLIALGETRAVAGLTAIRLGAGSVASVAGYFLAGDIRGFISGAVIGAVCGLAATHLALRKREISVVRQDLFYSLLLAALCLLRFGIALFCDGPLLESRPLISLICGAVVCCVVSLSFWKQLSGLKAAIKPEATTPTDSGD